MSDRLREFAQEIVRCLQTAGYEAYFAGGCVRDALLGRPAKDYDVATSARPEEVRALFGRRQTRAVGQAFGVILVIGAPDLPAVEVATFRIDLGYVDGRRPCGIRYATAREDALRRDFTINGMFYDPIHDQVLDFVGGQADLQARLIRAIGNPAARMDEDKLRMLRAPRFAATLEFTIESCTARAIQERAPQLAVVSSERITQELKRMLVDPHRDQAILWCEKLHLLQVIFPELTETWATHRELVLRGLHSLPPGHFEAALAMLLQSLPPVPVVEEICRRLKLSNREIQSVVWILSRQQELESIATWSLAEKKQLLIENDLPKLLAFKRAQLQARGGDDSPVQHCEELLRQIPPEQRHPPPLITGRDLQRWGLTPGPLFTQLLSALRTAQLNEEIHTREQAEQWIKQRIATDPPPTLT
ncbi:MAG: cytidine(C)-cytidine(C)-adenosine (A)]-adding enzyme [Planctomycetaceae bacterium]|nr:MAG: cytidine(C)-cytidine(C)-adenosine (A)]-adding enzyme [Planctomycetaceae bacterium]